MFCFGLTLTSLELRVLLVDHIEATLTTYDLAVGSALLQGCSCLHILNDVLFVSEYDSAFRQIVRTHFHFHSVTRKNLDVVHTHLSRDVSGNGMTVL